MLCSVCREKLAESEQGRKAHMARYHNVILEAQKKPEYKPMGLKAKAEQVARMEARLAGSLILNADGSIKKYGFKQEQETPVTPVLTNADFGFVKTIENKPITSWKEFDERLDALVEMSQECLDDMNRLFGTK